MAGKVYIGIGHKARQGKNEVASAIHNFYPEETAVIAFADALKVVCRTEYGMRTKYGPLLQRVGVERRAIDPDYWVNILRLTAEERPERFILIPDMRFPNEAAFCHVHIKVRRYDAYGKRYVCVDRDPNHESETALDGYAGWDYSLMSHEGLLEDLRQRARGVFRAIRDKYGRS